MVETSAAGVGKGRWFPPPAVAGVVEHGDLSRLRVGRIRRRQPAQPVVRHRKAGVRHGERIKDTFAQDGLDVLPRCPRRGAVMEGVRKGFRAQEETNE